MHLNDIDFKLTCVALLACFVLTGCASTPPKNTRNICSMFEDKRRWYKDAKRAAKKWNTDVSLIMAFMQRESSFVSNAKPPRRKILWVIPGPRLSDAYGYAQAKDDTWAEYMDKAGGVFATRDDFGDAADFIGWYNHISAKKCQLSTKDAYGLYLAYHEGQGGYNRGTYKKKKDVMQYANKVKKRTQSYRAQFKSCEAKLNKKRGFFF